MPEVRSPEAIERRRVATAARVARLRVDPAYREKRNAARRGKGAPRSPAKKKFNRVRQGRFVGCDGEGTTDPVTGAHAYSLFRMGDRELYEGGRRLETPEILQFITDHPDPHDYLVGFFFEYDVNCSLLDIERERDPARPKIPSRLERLLAIDINDWQGLPPPERRHHWTWLNFDGFPEFGVSWISRDHVSVCRSMADPKRPGRRCANKATTRTIEDVGGNFQCTFVKALQTWEIGDSATLAAIVAGKKGRETFATITPEIRRYNALECSLLADLMEKFRAATLAAGIVPRSWNGAGKLGAAMLKAAGMMRRKEYESLFPDGFRQMARDSFYGGRFETTRAGAIGRPVHALDINSAFPAAMLKLPCLRHGRFIRASADTIAQAGRSALYLCRVRFTHPENQFLCGLPIRSRKGPISWPRAGCGIYWSPEIRSARRLGAKVELLGGWLFEKRCNCRPYSFIRAKYRQRLKLGKNARGVPLKLGVNSVYGKRVQRVGSRGWTIHADAALITAYVRSWINDAIRTAGPRNVVMIAADCLFTVNRRPAVVIDKTRLGAWDAKSYPGLFVVQPGLYWPTGGKLKTRGVSESFFAKRVPDFENAWADYCADDVMAAAGIIKAPTVPALAVRIKAFFSLRLAYRLGDPAKGATWQTIKRKISFAWATKRRFEKMRGKAAILGPLAGDRDEWSYTYDDQGRRVAITLDDDGTIEGGDLMPSDMALFVEAMPDMIDLGPPHID